MDVTLFVKDPDELQISMENPLDDFDPLSNLPD